MTGSEGGCGNTAGGEEVVVVVEEDWVARVGIVVEDVGRDGAWLIEREDSREGACWAASPGVWTGSGSGCAIVGIDAEEVGAEGA